jgi:hypothetical protein
MSGGDGRSALRGVGAVASDGVPGATGEAPAGWRRRWWRGVRHGWGLHGRVREPAREARPLRRRRRRRRGRRDADLHRRRPRGVRRRPGGLRRAGEVPLRERRLGRGRLRRRRSFDGGGVGLRRRRPPRELARLQRPWVDAAVELACVDRARRRALDDRRPAPRFAARGGRLPPDLPRDLLELGHGRRRLGFGRRRRRDRGRRRSGPGGRRRGRGLWRGHGAARPGSRHRRRRDHRRGQHPLAGHDRRRPRARCQPGDPREPLRPPRQHDAPPHRQRPPPRDPPQAQPRSPPRAHAGPP